MGVSQLIIDAPLFFQMDKVKAFGIPVRAAANLSNRGILPTADAGVVGPWIRPEDVSIYEKYIDIIEFLQVNLKQEQALFRIYAEQHEWPGDVKLIINDLDSPALNRLIPPTFAKSRLNCGHRCQESGTCHICWRFLNLADEEKLRALT